MISAKGDASAPVEESRDYWFVALLGNLLWAASCFVPGAGIVKAATSGWSSFRAGAEVAVAAAQRGASREVATAVGAQAQAGMTSLGKAMYATMAVGGGLAASGIAQRLASDPSGEPSGKDVISSALNTKREKLGESLKRNEEGLAYDLVLSGFNLDRYRRDRAKYLNDVDEILWASLFPSIPFNDLTAIYNSGLNAINGALADFKSQYRVWRDNTQGCANRFYNAMRDPAYYGRVVDLPDEIKSGREDPLKYCQRRMPFRPKLNF